MIITKVFTKKVYMWDRGLTFDRNPMSALYMVCACVNANPVFVRPLDHRVRLDRR